MQVHSASYSKTCRRSILQGYLLIQPSWWRDTARCSEMQELMSGVLFRTSHESFEAVSARTRGNSWTDKNPKSAVKLLSSRPCVAFDPIFFTDLINPSTPTVTLYVSRVTLCEALSVNCAVITDRDPHIHNVRHQGHSYR